MHIRSKIILTLLILIVSIPTAFGKIASLTLLHTNDHHGHFMPYTTDKQDNVGGMAARATLVNKIRLEVGSHVLLLSAGDVTTGVPESDLLDNEPDIKLMNRLGYDAMVLGNHEFDKPVSVIKKKRNWAKFPLLSANVIDKKTNRSLVLPYVIKQYGDLSVAILGLTTEEASILIQPENIKGLRFESVISTAKRYVPILKQQADLVVVLTHIGYFDRSEYLNAAGDIALAKAVPEIDVIVGGHTNTVLYEPRIVGSTLIVQAGYWGKYLGRLDLKIDTDRNRAVDYDYDLIPVNFVEPGMEDDAYPTYRQDPQVKQLADAYQKKSAPFLSRKVGKALVDIGVNSRENLVRETPMGNLVADAMRMRTDADIAFQNGGGLRDIIQKGDITYRDVLSVLPFSNTLVLMKLTGRQVLEAIEFSCSNPRGHGGFLQVSGIQWTMKNGKVKHVKVKGEPLAPKRVYRVVTNSFVADGGDGYKLFEKVEKLDTGLMLSDVVIEEIAKKREIAPKVEGRIQVL